MGLAVLAVSFGGAGTAIAKPAGATAFLTEYADTPDQVVTQVERNRLVALRYARVFTKDPSAVLSYFRNELSLVTLDQTMQVDIYRLDESRRIVQDTRELKAGTKVFANRAGYPVLEYGTGNPLTNDLPARGVGRPASKPISKVADAQPQELGKPVAQAAPQPSPTTVDQALGQTNPPPVAPSNPIVPTEPGSTVINPSSQPTGGLPSGGGGGRISSGSGWLSALGAAAAAAALAGGRGSSSGIDGGGGAPQGGGEPPIVPEPASMMVLGTGLLTLGGVICRMRRK